MDFSIIEALAEQHETDAQDLSEVFEGFMSLSDIKDKALQITETLEHSAQAYVNMTDTEVIALAHHEQIIFTVDIDNVLWEDLALAYIITKDIHSCQMNRMDHQNKNDYDIYLKYLVTADEDLTGAISFIEEHIGFDNEPVMIKFVSEDIVISD